MFPTFNSVKSGRTAVGVAQVVAIPITIASKYILFQAPATNTGVVYVGDGNVSATASAEIGYGLAAGQSVVFPLDNVNGLKTIATVAAQGLMYNVFA